MSKKHDCFPCMTISAEDRENNVKRYIERILDADNTNNNKRNFKAFRWYGHGRKVR